MELNRAIIKALEDCINRGCQEGCFRQHNEIPMEEDYRIDLMRDALALIKELIEENARLRVVADMSDTTLTDASRIVNEFCDSRIKRAEANTARKMQGRLENRINNKLSYHGWYIKETVIPAVVEEILKETKK